MILLPELLSLLEAPARVHVNGKLTVLADLIERFFGDELNSLPMYHKCLIAQIAYVIQARTQLPMRKIIHMALVKYLKLSDAEIKKIGMHGTTPEQTINIWNGRSVTIDGKRYKLRCTFHAFHGVKELTAAVKAGHPVIAPFNIDSDFAAGSERYDSEGRYTRAEEEFYSPPDQHKDARHHVLLAVGVDDESEEVIMRDIRSIYLYKGYVKVPFDIVDQHLPLTFTFDVDLVAF